MVMERCCCIWNFSILLLSSFLTISNIKYAIAQVNSILVEERVLKYYSPIDLPNQMIALETYRGRQLQADADVINENLINRFTVQINKKFCGPASIANCMNALNLGYHIKYQSVIRASPEEKLLEEATRKGSIRLTEDDIVNAPNAQKRMNTSSIREEGATLLQLKTLIDCSGLGASAYFAYSSNVNLTTEKKEELTETYGNTIFRSLSEFRDFAKAHINRPLQALIVNYFMGSLGYEGYSGHFSPLAAYHAETDMFLVMDVWPVTPPVWVFAEDLFKAMATIDDLSKLPRGVIHLYELLV